MQIETSVRKGESKEEYTARINAELIAQNKKRREALESGELRVTMDVDDFGFLLPGYDDLLRLKKSLPNLKVTCFTIPLDAAFFVSKNAKHFKLDSYKRWANIINKTDWIEIAMHGFSHVPSECDIGHDKSNTLLDAVENIFDKVELEYVKLIKAPYWQMSYDFLNVCRDRGYTVAIDRNHMRPVPKGLRSYLYNWSFEEPIPFLEPIKGHGHFTGQNKNNIKDTLGSILRQLPATTKFDFVSDYLHKNDDSVKIMENYKK